MRECPYPFTHPTLGRGWVLQVDPYQETFLEDPFSPNDEALPIWLIEEALGTFGKKRLSVVWKRLCEWSVGTWGIEPDVALKAALWYPSSPFALGYRPTVTTPNYQMLVVFRGWFYLRNRRGVLTPLGERMDRSCWPSERAVRIAIKRTQERSAS